jgi:hypothetical protein
MIATFLTVNACRLILTAETGKVSDETAAAGTLNGSSLNGSHEQQMVSS